MADVWLYVLDRTKEVHLNVSRRRGRCRPDGGRYEGQFVNDRACGGASWSWPVHSTLLPRLYLLLAATSCYYHERTTTTTVISPPAADRHHRKELLLLLPLRLPLPLLLMLLLLLPPRLLLLPTL